MIFDIPTSKGTYFERYQELRNHLGETNFRFIKLPPFEICKDIEHLEKFCQDIMEQGGEGIILRDPSAPLQSGRSNGFLKHKKYRDAECRIVGRASAVSWECELPNSIRFIASSTGEFLKRWNPHSGDIVSFKHHGYLLSSKKPKVPVLYRIRNDLTWDAVIQNWKNPVIPSQVKPLQQKKPKHKRYWRNRKAGPDRGVFSSVTQGFFSHTTGWYH